MRRMAYQADEVEKERFVHALKKHFTGEVKTLQKIKEDSKNRQISMISGLARILNKDLSEHISDIERETDEFFEEEINVFVDELFSGETDES